jgi:MFS superfamily sulfate permease-like transporter
MLQQVGELHRRQVNLQEQVGELFPHLHNPKIEFAQQQRDAAQGVLSALAGQQQQLHEELTGVVAELREVEQQLDIPKRAAAIEDAAVAALNETKQAINALQNEPPAQILAAQDESAATLQGLLDKLKNHHIAAHLGLLAIATIVLWHFAPKQLKVIPGPLVAVVVATLAAVLFNLPVLYVEIPDNLWEGVPFPSLAVLREADLAVLLKMAVLVAVVASAETLLCASAVDQMHDGQRTDYDRELFAQGVGNSICGVLGVLPMTGVIVRSSANIQAGGKTRLSAVLHGVWLLIFVVALGFLLRQIPTASLAAILVYTGLKLVNIKDIRKLAIFGKSEVAIYAATVVTIVCTDLLTGVLVGVFLAAVKLLYTFSHLDARVHPDPEHEGRSVLSLYGAATFIRLPVLAAELERVPRGAELHVDFQHLDYIDHACLELLMSWAGQHEKTGGRLVIDWESLHARFQSTAKRTGNARTAADRANGVS